MGGSNSALMPVANMLTEIDVLLDTVSSMKSRLQHVDFIGREGERNLRSRWRRIREGGRRKN